MDIARPEGPVLDQTFPINVLDESLKKRFFKDEQVFLRSVAEDFPRTVYYVTDMTTISAANRRPLEQVDWLEHQEKMTFREFCDLGPTFLIDLKYEPVDPTQIVVRVDYPVKGPRKGGKEPLILEHQPSREKWTHRGEAGKFRISLDIASISEKLKGAGVKSTWPITLVIRYPT